MKLALDVAFYSDGDFRIEGADDPKNLLDAASPIYAGAEISISSSREEYDTRISLSADGDEAACRRAVSGLLAETACRVRTSASHYWLVRDLYDFLIVPMEKFLEARNGFAYHGTLGGNYEGTYISLHAEL